MRRLFIFLCAVILSYSSVAAAPAQALVIQHINVTYRRGDHSFQRVYTTEEDIQPLMQMLRSYYPYSDCAAPIFPSSIYITITVFCSGSTHTYEISDYCFLRRDGGQWQQIRVADPDAFSVFLLYHRGEKDPKKAA